MNSKLAWADRLIAVISPDYAPARYSPMEWASEIWEDPDGTRGSVVPVIVRPTSQMPALLKGLSRIDLTNCSEEEARRRLIKGVDMPTVPALKPLFERIEGEAPDSQHVGPDEKPTFVPNVKHISIFEKLALGSLLIGVVISALQYKQVGALFPNPFLFGFFQLCLFGFLLWIILLISRKRSKVAKWIWVIGSGLGVALYIPQLANMFDEGGYVGILSICQTAMQAVGIYLLFTPQSQLWFASKPAAKKLTTKT